MTAKLPSQLPSHVTHALEESFGRGFKLGRMAGIEAACQIIRDMPYSAGNIKLLELLTAEKHHDTQS